MPKPVKRVKLVTDMESSSCQILRMICRFGLHCFALIRTQNPQHNSQPMWLNISQGPGSDAGIPLKTSEMFHGWTWIDMNPWNKHALNSVSCPGSQRHLKGRHLMEKLWKTDSGKALLHRLVMSLIWKNALSIRLSLCHIGNRASSSTGKTSTSTRWVTSVALWLKIRAPKRP